MAELNLDIERVLMAMVKKGASDLHITVGSEPKIRVNGELVSLSNQKLSRSQVKIALYKLLDQKKLEVFEENDELDFAYEIKGVGRFRVNYFFQKGNPGGVFRYLSTEIKSLADLKMPLQLENLSTMPRGLVLVTGPTGSGKSTTLAAVLDKINRDRAGHIITIEDPIEYVHNHKKSIVNQREVGEDTESFKAALKHALRQDPDVILVGELRDLETISIALTAAETGHLVLASLHTQNAAQSVDRMIDVFPSEQQMQIRTQLASTLKAVVCQALLPTIDGKGRIAATEVMFVNSAIANLVREQKGHQIYTAIQSGKNEGMHTMDQSLAKLVNERKISYEVGLEKAQNIKAFDLLVDSQYKTSTMSNDWNSLESMY